MLMKQRSLGFLRLKNVTNAGYRRFEYVRSVGLVVFKRKKRQSRQFQNVGIVGFCRLLNIRGLGFRRFQNVRSVGFRRYENVKSVSFRRFQT